MGLQVPESVLAAPTILAPLAPRFAGLTCALQMWTPMPVVTATGSARASLMTQTGIGRARRAQCAKTCGGAKVVTWSAPATATVPVHSSRVFVGASQTPRMDTGLAPIARAVRQATSVSSANQRTFASPAARTSAAELLDLALHFRKLHAVCSCFTRAVAFFFAGAVPLVVINANGSAILAKIDLPGTLVSAALDAPSDLLVLLLSDAAGNGQVVRLLISDDWAAPQLEVISLLAPTYSRIHTLSTESTSSGKIFLLSNNLILIVNFNSLRATLYETTTGNVQVEIPLAVSLESVTAEFGSLRHAAATGEYIAFFGTSAAGVASTIAISIDTLQVYRVASTPYPLEPACVQNDLTQACISVLCGQISGTVIFFVVQRLDKLLLIRVDLSQPGSMMYDVVTSLASTEVTDMAIDFAAGVGYLSTSTTGNPTVMRKFNTTTAAIFGSYAFNVVGRYTETVIGTAVSSHDRILYALTSLPRLSIASINLFAVHSVSPSIADTRGGTYVTITGEGFVSSNTSRCLFGGTTQVVAINTGNAIICSAPASDPDATDACSGQVVEVALWNDNRWTNNELTVRRVASPSTTAASPTYGSVAGGTIVTVTGYGFVASPYLGCRFGALPELRVSVSATFISSFEMRCEQPAFLRPTTAPAYLQVTLDGQSFSGKLEYNVIGTAADLNSCSTCQDTPISTSDVVITLTASQRALVDPISLWVTDEHGNFLLTLDTTTRLSMAWISAVDPLASSNGRTELSLGGSTMRLSTRGRVHFSDLLLVSPPTGVLKLSLTVAFSYEEADGSSAEFANATRLPPVLRQQPFAFRVLSVTVNIVPGISAAVQIAQQPSTESNNADRLLEQPKLYLLDEAENRILQTTDTVVVATSFSPDPPSSETEVIFFSDGEFQFKKLLLVGKHGVEYRLIFAPTVTSDATSRLLPQVQSSTISVGLCRGTEYGKLYSPLCLACPENARCNGSTVLLAATNSWRYGNASTFFYKCGASEPCLGGTLTGTCKTGFEGALCSTCQRNYVGKKCRRCPAALWLSWTPLIAAVLAVITALLVFLTLNLNKVGTSDALPTLLKLLVNHLQVSSRIADININIPPVLASLFQIQQSASHVELSVATYRCIFPNVTYYFRFTVIMMLPLLSIPLAAAVPLFIYCSRNRKRQAQIQRRRNALGGKRMLHLREFMEWSSAHPGEMAPQHYRKQLWKLSLLSYIIVIYLLYPTVISTGAKMIRCVSYRIGQDESDMATITVLIDDMSVDCTTSLHRRYERVAMLCMVAFGLGLPGAFVGMYLWFSRVRGLAETQRTFAFLVADYKVKRWYWECIVTLRKLLIVLIVVFLRDARLQCYAGMWTMCTNLAVQWRGRPFLNPLFDKLEGLSLCILTITLNLQLLYYWDITDPYSLLLTIALMFFQGIVILSYLLNILRSSRAFLRKKWNWVKSHIFFDETKVDWTDAEPELSTRPQSAASSETKRFTSPRSEGTSFAISGHSAPSMKPPLLNLELLREPAGLTQSTQTVGLAIKYFSGAEEPQLDCSEFYDQGLLVDDEQEESELYEGDFEEEDEEEEEDFDEEASEPAANAVAPQLPDIQNNSNLSLYYYFCEQYGTAPLSEIAQLLTTERGEYEMEEFNLENRLLPSPFCLLPLFEVLQWNAPLKILSLRNTGLDDRGITFVIQLMERHPHLEMVDLSENCFTNIGGHKLLEFIKKTNRIIQVDHSNSYISDPTLWAAIQHSMDNKLPNALPTEVPEIALQPTPVTLHPPAVRRFLLTRNHQTIAAIARPPTGHLVVNSQRTSWDVLNDAESFSIRPAGYPGMSRGKRTQLLSPATHVALGRELDELTEALQNQQLDELLTSSRSM
eukprot:TRINITY_DN11848_c0_g1_i1.p1 TRINITY_DN11848_c0_g1~~TRINITY_DN11848_c0_g1_i1.p1  ORF type:complete len:1848 (-),score=223.38 TRINITY_DN11848_c0_g1_i1:175-5718(-)